VHRYLGQVIHEEGGFPSIGGNLVAQPLQIAREQIESFADPFPFRRVSLHESEELLFPAFFGDDFREFFRSVATLADELDQFLRPRCNDIQNRSDHAVLAAPAYRRTNATMPLNNAMNRLRDGSARIL
jgi:hypothetical protein